MKKSVLLISCVLLVSLFAISFVSAEYKVVNSADTISLLHDSGEDGWKFIEVRDDHGGSIEGNGKVMNGLSATGYSEYSADFDDRERFNFKSISGGDITTDSVFLLTSELNNYNVRFKDIFLDGSLKKWIFADYIKGYHDFDFKIIKADGSEGDVRYCENVYLWENDEGVYFDVDTGKIRNPAHLGNDKDVNTFQIRDINGGCPEIPEEGCTIDDDCPDGQECNTGTGECYTPGEEIEPACEEDEDCGDGSFCNDDDVCESNPVNPVTCDGDEECEANQIIMSLTDYINAHGSSWDNDESVVKLYFSEIFQSVYQPDADEDVRDCTGENVVVKLDSLNQGHAYDPASEDEDLEAICYGDLSCELVETNRGCDEGYNALLSLSSPSNAHIGYGRRNEYAYKICCKSSTVEPPITSCDVDEVLCTRTDGSTYCSEEDCESGEFSCNNDNKCDDNENCMCADCHGVQDSCNEGLVCNYSTDRCGVCSDGTEFQVVDNVGQCVEDPGFLVEIISPEDETAVVVDAELTFDVEITSMKKDVSITWDFGDGELHDAEPNCLTDNDCSITHSFSEPRAYVVKVTAEEQGGFRSDVDYIEVFVYGDGVNVFARITEPNPLEIIEGRANVFFNASETFVSNCTTDSDECDASNDAEDGLGCYEVEAVEGGLYCYDMNKEKIGPKGEGLYDLEFTWVFDKDKAYETGFSGVWGLEFNESVEFNRSFFTLGLHTAHLTVAYGQSEEEECEQLWYYDEADSECVEGACDIEDDVETYETEDDCRADLEEESECDVGDAECRDDGSYVCGNEGWEKIEDECNEIDENSLESPCGDYGDVNDDGYITELDAALISALNAGYIGDGDLNMDNADVNDDGEVLAEDASIILGYVGSERESFPVCSEDEE